MRIALIDGPLAAGQGGCTARLDPWGGAVEDSPAGRHAAAVAEAIRAGMAGVAFLSIPVFQGRLAARAADLAQALVCAAESGAEIVHCSLGLARDDAEVARAVAMLSGRVVVASAPARGGPVWPAANPDVIAVQGDARCGPGEWSLLGLPTADYGACPHRAARPDIAGASIAAAHLTGILAGARCTTPDAARRHLSQGAAHVGRERRTG